MFIKKFNLVICELHNKYLHGIDSNSDPTIKGHYLCMFVSRETSIFDTLSQDYDDEDSDDELEPHIYDVMDIQKNNYLTEIYQYDCENLQHDYIRNYKNIVSKINYIQPQIAEIIYLDGGECVAIIKTFWLKCVQRAWKKIFNRRKIIIQNRMNINSILHRHLTGKWNEYLPGIEGMFWN